jgi:hypothetical protein
MPSVQEMWSPDTVRAELDAVCAHHHIGTFRSRYTLSGAELFVLCSHLLLPCERLLVRTILNPLQEA